MTIKLRGLTWNHSRGYLPMVATAQRFAELHPDFDVVWEKRPLKSFDEDPVESLDASVSRGSSDRRHFA